MIKIKFKIRSSGSQIFFTFSCGASLPLTLTLTLTLTFGGALLSLGVVALPDVPAPAGVGDVALVLLGGLSAHGDRASVLA